MKKIEALIEGFHHKPFSEIEASAIMDYLKRGRRNGLQVNFARKFYLGPNGIKASLEMGVFF